MAAVHHASAAGQIDWSLRRDGYCGAIDSAGRCRCYRRAGHSGDCTFSDTFQLCHPRLGPVTTRAPRRQ